MVIELGAKGPWIFGTENLVTLKLLYPQLLLYCAFKLSPTKVALLSVYFNTIILEVKLPESITPYVATLPVSVHKYPVAAPLDAVPVGINGIMQRYFRCPQFVVFIGVIVIDVGATGTFKALTFIFKDLFALYPHAEAYFT